MKKHFLFGILICSVLLAGCATDRKKSGVDLQEPGTFSYLFSDYFKQDPAELVALSDWSDAVLCGHFRVRGRLVIFEHKLPSPPDSDNGTTIKVCVELQNFTMVDGEWPRIYFDLDHALQCTMRDSADKILPPRRIDGGGWAGPYPKPCWIPLPYDSSVFLRANLNFSGRTADRLGIAVNGLRGDYWSLPPHGTDIYFLDAAFVSTPPTNSVAGTNEPVQDIWQGTLSFPRIKLQFNKW